MHLIQGRAYTVSWLVQIKSYVIATSDLWLFIHASNLLPLLPTPLPYTYTNEINAWALNKLHKFITNAH